MNWNKIKEKYPKAFYTFKKSYLLYEMAHNGDLLLMERLKHDTILGQSKYQSIDKSIIFEFFLTRRIKLKIIRSMDDMFISGFELLEKQLK